MIRHVNDDTIALIKQWEGLRLQAYRDPVGIWTIGYGHTRDVQPGRTITEAEAERLLRADLAEAEAVVAGSVTVPLSDHRFGALVSLVYNIGAGAFAGSTLLRRLNAGDYDAVPGELQRWVYAGGRKLTGLVNRRAAESALWVRGMHVSSACIEAAPPPPVPVRTTDTGKAAQQVGGIGLIAVVTQAVVDASPALAALKSIAPWLAAAAVIAAIAYVLVQRARRARAEGQG